MTEPSSGRSGDRPREPGDRRPATPGRLDRPPSSRYPAALARTPDGPGPVGPGRLRGPLIAVATTLAAAAIVVVLVGPVGTMTGLLFVAGVSGLVIGAQVPSRPAIALAVLSVFGGDAGAWLFARSEGGVLGLEAYLQETFGPYLAGQVAIAVLTSWYAARRAAAIRGEEPRARG